MEYFPGWIYNKYSLGKLILYTRASTRIKYNFPWDIYFIYDLDVFEVYYYLMNILLIDIIIIKKKFDLYFVAILLLSYVDLLDFILVYCVHI